MAHLYIIEGSGGLFKLGRTTNFANRFAQLKNEFKRHGEEVSRIYCFPNTTAPVEAEYALREAISWRFRGCRASGFEWFRDVDFAFAVRRGEHLTKQANKGNLKTATQMEVERMAHIRQENARIRELNAQSRRRHAAIKEVRTTGWMTPVLELAGYY